MGDDDAMSGDSTKDDGLTVGRTAELLGVSVRTLHHWDDIALASPSERTHAGYRVYTADDIARLQRVLVYRELGMPLAQIAEALDDPGTDVAGHLARQRDLLTARISRLQEMVSAVDRLMEVREMDEKLTPQEQARAFGSDWDAEWREEAEDRWGGTADWEKSERRRSQMTADDWKRVGAETEELESALAAAMAAGVEPGSAKANELAERHLTSLDEWMDMTHAKHVLVASGYVADPRFRAHYEKRAEGLADWLRAIIDANARAHGVDPETAAWE